MIDFLKRKYTFFRTRYKVWRFNRRKPSAANSVDPTIPITVYYRLSDGGYPKNKPSYINNENCLRNAVLRFPLNSHSWIVIADNCCDQTCEMIYKYIPKENVIRAKVGHGAGTFRMTYDMALKQDDNSIVYFLENDYIHRQGCSKALREGLELSPYVTLYDHPDKYRYDHFLYSGGGENSKVYLSPSCHWKVTHSTTMTLAAKVKTLREDKNIFYRWTNTRHPFDCQIFMDLNRKGRTLISPIPSYSTHGEIEFLAPFVDWTMEAAKTE